MGLFGNKKDENEGPKMPGMGEIMGYLMKYGSLFSGAGEDPEKMRAAIATVIQDFATERNIQKFTGGAISGLAALQQTTGTRYILKMEGTADNQDILIQIYTRSVDLQHVELYETISLRSITQQHILNLVNILLNGFINTGQRQLNFPGNPATGLP